MLLPLNLYYPWVQWEEVFLESLSTNNSVWVQTLFINLAIWEQLRNQKSDSSKFKSGLRLGNLEDDYENLIKSRYILNFTFCKISLPSTSKIWLHQQHYVDYNLYTSCFPTSCFSELRERRLFVIVISHFTISTRMNHFYSW